MLLHPNLSQLYRQQVARLVEALNDEHHRTEAAEIIRGLIDRIVLTPNDEGGLDVQLYGDLARYLQFCEAGERRTRTPRPWWTGAWIVGGCGGRI